MNRNTLISLAAFAIGAAAGSVATWAVVKTKYERIAQEEIDSVKEVFSKEAEKEIEEVTEEDPEVKKAELKSYKDVLGRTSYTGYSDGIADVNEMIANKAKDIVDECAGIVNKEGGNESMPKDGPYIIPPDVFGEDDEYEVVTLVCYADGVITEYENGEVVDDVEGAIGPDDIRTHFGEYEEDSVFVRNEERKVDYEILRDEGSYEETMS